MGICPKSKFLKSSRGRDFEPPSGNVAARAGSWLETTEKKFFCAIGAATWRLKRPTARTWHKGRPSWAIFLLFFFYKGDIGFKDYTDIRGYWQKGAGVTKGLIK
jgi:hypothetical protein